MNSNQEWQDCPPGELVRLAGHAKSQQLRRRIVLGGGVAMAVLLVGVFLMPRQSEELTEPNYGGIRCSAVRKQARAYLSGNLDADLETKIVLHLKMCPICQAYVKNLGTKQANQAGLNVSFQQFVSFQKAAPAQCSCPHCLGSATDDRRSVEIR